MNLDETMEEVAGPERAPRDDSSEGAPRPDATGNDRPDPASAPHSAPLRFRPSVLGAALTASSLAIRQNVPEGAKSTYVLRYFGDPILKEKARRVDDPTLADRNLILALEREMAKYNGLGMAAQQVGGIQRVCVARFATYENDKRKLADKNGGRVVPRSVFILVNPSIVARSEEMALRAGEGCLSVPGFRTSVKRHTWVDLRWYDHVTGLPEQRHLEGLDAQIAQHELDHLDGICIADGVSRQQRREAERLAAKARARA